MRTEHLVSDIDPVSLFSGLIEVPVLELQNDVLLPVGCVSQEIFHTPSQGEIRPEGGTRKVEIRYLGDLSSLSCSLQLYVPIMESLLVSFRVQKYEIQTMGVWKNFSLPSEEDIWTKGVLIFSYNSVVFT